ncbi:MAG TPA: sodium:calcium antiporter [Planctomycetaceae bacterium]|nr:sodium:calcium antiporter [Planctomycetaceae bacterium]
MEDALHSLLSPWPLWALILVVVGGIAVLGWAAELLVREAVALSERSGIPKVVIGATVVSLGTTTPEVAVSVMAALQGDPGLALSNAVGSIICDTGLVLGAACLAGPLPLPANIVNRQGWVQLAAAVLLVAASWPWLAPLSVFQGPARESVGRLPQSWGFVFLGLLLLYLWLSVRWARRSRDVVHLEELEVDVRAPLPLVLAKLFGAVALVIVSASIVIAAVGLVAERIGVPQAIIGATVVALGTSLPELVTGVMAARRGHGDLAVGNVVGADILNALFVAGASAAVTTGGLAVSTDFYRWLFPFMLAILVVFRISVVASRERMRTSFGVLLLGMYVVYVAVLVVRTVIAGPAAG